MSERRVRRLDAIRDEFLAASEALDHCLRQLDDRRFVSDERPSERTIDRLPATYVVRLTSETEGMLYRHLLRFPANALGAIVIGPKTQAADLVNLAGAHPKRGSTHEMNPKVRNEAWAVLDYRNGGAQGGKTAKPYVDFGAAHRRLVAFVRKLEDASDA